MTIGVLLRKVKNRECVVITHTDADAKEFAQLCYDNGMCTDPTIREEGSSFVFAIGSYTNNVTYTHAEHFFVNSKYYFERLSESAKHNIVCYPTDIDMPMPELKAGYVVEFRHKLYLVANIKIANLKMGLVATRRDPILGFRYINGLYDEGVMSITKVYGYSDDIHTVNEASAGGRKLLWEKVK